MNKELTRRHTDARLETWEIFYGDLSVGTIAKLEPDPVKRDQVWRWTCGIYPGAHPSENEAGTAETFEQAREKWQAAWERFLPKRRPEDFEEYRRHLQYMADKLAGRLPPMNGRSIMRCACGVDFDSHDPAQVQKHAQHVNLVKRAKIGGW